MRGRSKYLRFPELLARDVSAAQRAALPIWSQIMRYFGNECRNMPQTTDISSACGRGFAKSKISSQVFILGYNEIGVGGLFTHHSNIAVCNMYRGRVGGRRTAPREVIYLTFAASKKSNHAPPVHSPRVLRLARSGMESCTGILRFPPHVRKRLGSHSPQVFNTIVHSS